MEVDVIPVSSGMIAGESLMGVAIALLTASGIIFLNVMVGILVT